MQHRLVHVNPGLGDGLFAYDITYLIILLQCSIMAGPGGLFSIKSHHVVCHALEN